MQSFLRMEFVSSSAQTISIAAAIRAFLQHSREWKLMREESADYAVAISGEAIIARWLRSAGTREIAIAIASERDQETRMRLANIVPASGSISVGEYNTIARQFATSFRRYLKEHATSITVRIVETRYPTELRQILPGEKTRAIFERFLLPGNTWQTPTITHPADIERLDTFICALYRYKAACHLGALHRWLVVHKKWPAKDATWLCDRIECGRQILAADRRF